MLCSEVLNLLRVGEYKLFPALKRVFVGASVRSFTGELDASASIFKFACPL